MKGEETKEEKIVPSKSAPLKQEASSKIEKSGLSLESKEYQVTQKTKKVDSLSEAIEGKPESEASPPTEPKKKGKSKKNRSNKARKKPHNNTGSISNMS